MPRDDDVFALYHRAVSELSEASILTDERGTRRRHPASMTTSTYRNPESDAIQVEISTPCCSTNRLACSFEPPERVAVRHRNGPFSGWGRSSPASPWCRRPNWLLTSVLRDLSPGFHRGVHHEPVREVRR